MAKMERLKELLDKAEKISKIEKCETCQCFYDVLMEMREALKEPFRPSAWVPGPGLPSPPLPGPRVGPGQFLEMLK